MQAVQQNRHHTTDKEQNSTEAAEDSNDQKDNEKNGGLVEENATPKQGKKAKKLKVGHDQHNNHGHGKSEHARYAAKGTVHSAKVHHEDV